MNRILLGYGTRYGTTRQIATEIADVLRARADVDLVDLKRERPPRNLIEYDLVVIGTGIQAGRWTSEAIKFIEKNRDSLAQLKIALFVVCGYAASPDKRHEAQAEYLDAIMARFPELKVVATGLFPGMFDMSKYSPLVRFIIKRMLPRHEMKSEHIPEVIDLRDMGMVRAWTEELVERFS
ncbi:MAG: flavodoxin domain-containing protein [Candidatus Thorarchaeota archaeon]